MEQIYKISIERSVEVRLEFWSETSVIPLFFKTKQKSYFIPNIIYKLKV